MAVNHQAELEREAKFHDAVYGETRIDRSLVQRLLSFDSPEMAFGDRLPRLKTKLLQALGNVKGKDVLIYGCGEDNAALWFSKSGAHADAIDISPKAIEDQNMLAEIAGLDIHAMVMDANSLELPSDHYDILYGNGILHHLRLDEAAVEMRRVLKVGGKAVFRDVMKGGLLLRMFRYATPSARTPDEHPLEAKDLAWLAANFDKCEIDYFVLLALPYRFIAQTVNAGVFKKIGLKMRIPHPDSLYARLDALDCRLFRLFPFLRKRAWLCLVVLTR